MYNIQSEHKYVILTSIYNLPTTCFGHLTWPSSGLYLAYRGLYYITSVSNGRQDLVYNGWVHELN